MSSTFTWLDQSDDERRKVLDVIDLFKDRETRDELGLGSIRDGFADLLFPGTSTIQTRARYFLLIPWAYHRVERGWTGRSGVADRARAEEINLIEALLAGGETDGVIGKQARASLKRLPSDAYWEGLRAWGIRRFPGSREQYHRAIESGALAEPTIEDANDDLGAGEQAGHGAWHANVPRAPDGFPKTASLSLTVEESNYLSERILATAPSSLLAWLVKNGRAPEPVKFAWEHPQVDELPPRLREFLEHARFFSETMHGAALLYNLMLAERSGNEQLTDEYGDRLRMWAGRLDLTPWDRGGLWEAIARTNAKRDPRTKAFVDRWLGFVIEGDPRRLADEKAARGLLRDREVAVKRGHARLANDRALETWGGAAGTAQLDYRWGTTQTHLRDLSLGAASDQRDA
jgi:hypothetical protein